MNKRTVFVNVELVAKAIIEDVEIRPGDGNLDAHGRIVVKSFPPITAKDILDNLDRRMVRLPNRWTYILPRRNDIVKQIRNERDWMLSEHIRTGNKIRSKETGRMVSCKDYTKKISLCNKLMVDLLPPLTK